MFKKNTGADAAVSALISGSPTIGFLGFAVLEPIFGTTPAVALVVAIVGIVVNAIGIPVGLSLMNASLEKQNPSSGKKESAWKAVIHALEQPVAWAPILAVILVLCGLNLKMLVVACALPPAFSGIIIADEYDTYVATGTSSLTLSVLLFIAFCPLWLWVTELCIQHPIFG